MRKSKLKSNGSETLVIENAQLLGRKGLSVQANFGEVKIVKTSAFNPALTVDQLMKQALNRVHRTVGESEHSWQVSCEVLSFAVATEIFQPLSIDLDSTAGELLRDADEVSPIDVALSDRDLAKSELDDLGRQLLNSGMPGSLVVVGRGEVATSMSFRLDATTIQEKLTEIIGELTRDGSDRTGITVKLYGEGVRSRKELENAQPLAEFSVGNATSKPSLQTPPEPPLRELDLSERYRIGLMSWVKRSSAKVLLIDGMTQYLAPAAITEMVEYLRQNIGEGRLCLIFESEQPTKLVSVTKEQISRYDELQLEFRRKINRARVIDWIGGEADLAKMFAPLPDARRNGLVEKDFIRSSTRFHCPACSGKGYLESNLGPFGVVRSACALCSMTGFGESVLQVKLRDVQFRDLLSESITSLSPVFERFRDVSLGELRLGDSLQLASTCSQQGLILSRLGSL